MVPRECMAALAGEFSCLSWALSWTTPTCGPMQGRVATKILWGVTVKNLLGWEPVSIVHYTWPGCPFVFSDLTYNL